VKSVTDDDELYLEEVDVLGDDVLGLGLVLTVLYVHVQTTLLHSVQQ